MTSPGSVQRSNGFGLGVLAGAFTGALVIAVVWLLVVPSPDAAVPAPAPSPSQTTITPTPPPSASPSTRPTAPVTPSGQATPELSVPPGESPDDANPDDAAPEADVITELPSGSWVTVLKSLPQAGLPAAEAIERAKEFGNAEHPAGVLDTNAFPGLTPNYWAIVIPGSASRDESNLVCAALGLPVGNRCYARPV